MGNQTDAIVDSLIGGRPTDRRLETSETERSTTATNDIVDHLLRGGVDQNLVGAGDSIYQSHIPKGSRFEDLNVRNKDAGANDPNSADFTTLLKAAAVDDPETKKRIFAKARFGDENAASRYVMIDDRPVYEGKDGDLYTEAPLGIVNGAKRFLADLGGHAAPIVGGIIGGGVAAGPPGAIAGAGLGAAGGAAVRSALAGLVFDEPVTAGGVASSMATEGAFGAGGAAVGAGITKGLNRGLARDFGSFDKQAASELQTKARRFGVDLNAAQLSGVPSVKAQFEALARIPESRDVIDQAMQRQSEQAYKAAGDFLRQVSPREGMEEVGEQGVSAAQKVIAALLKDRSDAAAPVYQKAFGAGINFTPENNPALKSLMDRPAMQDAMKKAVVMARNEGLDATGPANSLLRAHMAGLALSDAIAKDTQYQASGSFVRNGLLDTRRELLKALDAVSPDYAQARGIFSAASPSVEAIRSGIMNRVANLPDEKVSSAARLFFQPGSSPLTVLNNREIMVKAGMANDYNALLKSYLQQTLDKAGREYKSGATVGQAPAWRAMLEGDPAQAKVLRAAMDAKQYASYRDLMEVFDRMGQVTGKGNSITMPMQEAAAQVRRDAGTSLPTKVNTALRAWDWPKALGNWLDQARQGDYSKQLAEMMVNPDEALKLRQLVQLDPNTDAFIRKAATVFGVKMAPNPSTDD